MRKPVFLRSESRRRKRISDNWRKPRGIQNKVRLRRRGKPVMVNIGYGSDKKTRFLINNMKPVLISNIRQLALVDKEKEIIVLSRFGKKKKIAILNKVKELGLKILNVKNIDKDIKIIQEMFEKRKKIRKEKLARKKEKSKKEDKKKEKKKEKLKEEAKEEKSKEEAKEEESKEEARKEEKKLLEKVSSKAGEAEKEEARVEDKK